MSKHEVRSLCLLIPVIRRERRAVVFITLPKTVSCADVGAGANLDISLPLSTDCLKAA